MELVYLWVEDYKNIKKQGFNFSPRFECNYNPDTNELTIDENKEYMSIFPENINVTAIVGKNGSGKSSVLEAIQILLACSEEKESFKECKIFGIFYNEKEFFQKNYQLDKPLLKNIKKYLKYKDKKTQEYNKKNYPYLLSHNYMTEALPSCINEYFNNDKFVNILMLQPYRKDNKLDINFINYLANQNIYNFMIKNDLKFKNIETFFQPVQFHISIQLHKITHKDEYFKNYIEQKRKEILSNNLDEYIVIKKENLIDLTYLYILKHILNVSIIRLILDKKSSWLNCLFKKCYTIDKVFNEIKSLKNSEELIKKYNINDNYGYNKTKIEQSFKFIHFIKKQPKNFKLDTQKKYSFDNNLDKELLLNIAPWINIKLFNKDNISFESLSYGQKFLIRFIYSVLYQLEKLSSMKYQYINLLLDEVEIGLHPQWQKEFINLLLNIIKIYNASLKKHFILNIILTTHSPFLLSDIPKQNIIFLDTYKEEDEEVKNGKQKVGNCKVVDGLNDKKQTFGANIHTLLSDSFFMDDGLMGEFAKNKIRTIKVAHRYVLHKHKRKILFTQSCKRCRRLLIKQLPKFWQIQNIIGEPFLQKIVKNQLEEIELILLGKDEAIDKEIARLQALKEGR